MKARELRVTMPDGSVWSVPAKVIARHRADTLREIHIHNTNEQWEGWNQEIEFALNDKEVLADWARNNMNWKDVVLDASQVSKPTAKVDYQEGWVNGPMEIVEEVE